MLESCNCYCNSKLRYCKMAAIICEKESLEADVEAMGKQQRVDRRPVHFQRDPAAVRNGRPLAADPDPLFLKLANRAKVLFTQRLVKRIIRILLQVLAYF
jgi:hypothetical protein